MRDRMQAYAIEECSWFTIGNKTTRRATCTLQHQRPELMVVQRKVHQAPARMSRELGYSMPSVVLAHDCIIEKMQSEVWPMDRY